MNVALILFPISAEGGLSTRVLSTIRAFQAEGHNATFFRIAYSDKSHRAIMKDVQVRPTPSGMRVEQGWLSITDAKLRETIAILNSFDLIMFVHPCPHFSDTQKAVANWPALYRDTKPPKVVTFSDVYMDKYYPWITSVRDLFTPLSNNNGIQNHLARIGWDSTLLPYCFHTDVEIGLRKDKRNGVVWPHAWRGWKGIESFVRAANDIEGEVHLYGGGREESNLQAEILSFKPHVKKLGFRETKEVHQSFCDLTCSVELAGASEKYHGHFNRATIEPMLFGCVLACRETMVHPHSIIPSSCAHVIDPTKVASELNLLMRDRWRMGVIAREAFDWAAETFAPKKVVAAILSASATPTPR
jgi:hypothetical protein